MGCMDVLWLEYILLAYGGELVHKAIRVYGRFVA